MKEHKVKIDGIRYYVYVIGELHIAYSKKPGISAFYWLERAGKVCAVTADDALRIVCETIDIVDK